jgi:hypothetical protein
MPSLLDFRGEFVARAKIVVGDDQLRAQALVFRAEALLRLGRNMEAMVVVAPVLPGGALRGDAELTLWALIERSTRLTSEVSQLSRHVDYPRRKLEGLHIEAYGRMCAQHIERARQDVVRLVSMRHESNLHDAYGFHELCGDVHLAAARRALALPTIDPDTSSPGPVGPPDGADPIDAAHEARRARAAYRSADRLADRLDAAFDGTYYRNRLRLRRTLLDELPLNELISGSGS